MSSFLQFAVQNLPNAAIAMLIGYLWRPAPGTRPWPGEIGLVFLTTWAFVAVVAVPGIWLFALVGAEPLSVSTLGGSVLPIAAGAVFARLRLNTLRTRP